MASRASHTRLDPEVRRELILDAAERVMAGRLPAEVTFEEVADAAEVSRALVYNYFRDRTGLLVALAERTLDRLDREVLGALDPGADLAAQVEALGQAYMRHGRTNASTWTLLSRSGLLDHPTVQGARAARVAHIARMWGDTPDARLAAWSVTALYEVSGFNALPDDVAEADLPRFLRDLLAPGLTARGVGPVATSGA
ncbi:helix-turn-helix domain containing protein [Iamia majanohamensis]|uniref:Helix-turn-helix domain containing protein n=1 Tax=Iamia majanohamensis TaxID=467976 RepID=A0AAF0BTM7_9ACTN|nr:TetR/AcrR family transcriptional regulator [Iamia majanohamensis]WCO65065.1 helix-turn-helix domain containing protein [Iamia majanohamensis]